MVGQTVPPGGGRAGGQVDRDVCWVGEGVETKMVVAQLVEVHLVLVGSGQVEWLLLQLHPGKRMCDRLSRRFLHD